MRCIDGENDVPRCSRASRRRSVDSEVVEEEVDDEASAEFGAGAPLLGVEVLSLRCRSPQNAKAGFFLAAWLTGSSMTNVC